MGHGPFHKENSPPEGRLAKGDAISQKQGQDLDLAALCPSSSSLLLVKKQIWCPNNRASCVTWSRGLAVLSFRVLTCTMGPLLLSHGAVEMIP